MLSAVSPLPALSHLLPLTPPTPTPKRRRRFRLGQGVVRSCGLPLRLSFFVAERVAVTVPEVLSF